METASMPGLLKVIFTIIIIYYITKFLMKLFLPVMAQQVVRKAQENMENQRRFYEEQQRSQSYNQQQHTGNNQAQKQEKPKDKPVVGEYIDFEELD